MNTSLSLRILWSGFIHHTCGDNRADPTTAGVPAACGVACGPQEAEWIWPVETERCWFTLKLPPPAGGLSPCAVATPPPVCEFVYDWVNVPL